jgi:hypothetical protein
VISERCGLGVRHLALYADVGVRHLALYADVGV